MSFLLNPFRLAPLASGNIQFVGRNQQKGTVNGKTMSLTSLTGGIGTAAIDGDFVVGICACSSAADRNPDVTGYAQFADIAANDTNRALLQAGYKFMTSTPDTTISCTVGSVDSSGGMIFSAYVFRGVNLTTPLDTFTENSLTFRNNNGTNSADPDPVVGTPQTPGAKLLIINVSAHAQGAVNLSQSYLSDAYVDNYDGTTRDVSVAIGTVDWTGGAYNPDVATLTGGGITDSWATSMIAMRPL